MAWGIGQRDFGSELECYMLEIRGNLTRVPSKTSSIYFGRDSLHVVNERSMLASALPSEQ